MDLKEFFEKNKKIALAFSGGADSAYLLYCAKLYSENVKAYYFNSQFQPSFELEDAIKLADELGVELEVITADLKNNPNIIANTELRCYYCKNNMLKIIKQYAQMDGYSVIIDGTNASDDEAQRSGMKALSEYGILSPLRLCGITKAEVYALSKKAGLFTCNKPSNSCLATRIPTNMSITDSLLKKIERAEEYLALCGFSDFRLRVLNEKSAKIQLKKEQLEKCTSLLEKIREELKADFSEILIDTEVFR